MQKIRVLFLFSHLHKGGMQNAVSRISRSLPECWKQYVAYFGTDNPGFDFRAEHIFFNTRGGDYNLFVKFSKAVKRMILLHKFVAKEQIDIVVSFGEAANILNLASRHSARKIISTRVAIRDALTDLGWAGTLYGLLAHSLYRYADMVVPVTERIANELRVAFQIPIEKIFVIPNLYNICEIRNLTEAPLPDEYSTFFKNPVILNVGSLCNQKGQDLLLHAFALVNRRIPESRLMLVGEGPWKDRLKKQSESLDVASRVLWVGFDQNPYRYMARSSVFVLASRYEGFPNVLVEAMICGCPVVSFDCPTGPREILQEDTWGMLVENGNINCLADRIIEMLLDRALAKRLMAAGKERSQSYGSQTVGGLWVQCLNSVLITKENLIRRANDN